MSTAAAADVVPQGVFLHLCHLTVSARESLMWTTFSHSYSHLATKSDLLEYVFRVQIVGAIFSMGGIFKFGVSCVGKGIILCFISRRTSALFPMAENTSTLSFVDSRLSPFPTSLQSRFSFHHTLANSTTPSNFIVCLQNYSQNQDWRLLWGPSALSP